MDALQKIPTPVDVPRDCVFLGLANYCSQFIKNFGLIAKHLTILMSNNMHSKHGWPLYMGALSSMVSDLV